MDHDAKANGVWTGIAGLIMLAYSWNQGGWIFPADAGQVYRAALSVFDWMLELGGFCLLGTAVLCFIGLRLGLLLDAIFSGLCGMLLILCTIPWVLHDGIGLYYLLYLIFGGMFISAARGCWASYTSSAPAAARSRTANGDSPPPAPRSWLGIPTLKPPTARPPPEAEPPHPASIRPKSIAPDGPPPPEGYLAALSKEDEEPPTAAHK